LLGVLERQFEDRNPVLLELELVGLQEHGGSVGAPLQVLEPQHDEVIPDNLLSSSSVAVVIILTRRFPSAGFAHDKILPPQFGRHQSNGV
jgi:hypothetical protein